MKTGYRLCLVAAMICLALVLSVATSATLQAQDDNTNQTSAIKPQRTSSPKRRTRRARRRATASKTTAVNRDGQLEATPKVAPPVQATRLPPGIYADPVLHPPQRGTGVGNGPGVGAGVGGGIGPGPNGGIGSDMSGGGGGGMGGGPVDYSRTFSPRDVDRKARILSKPEPLMTEAAKRNKTVGTVVMRVTFAASGEVENIRVVQGLPDGLSESAIEAARRIKFQPAMKDGRIVSQYIQIEYNFNDY